jgi:hydrophobe/amphiphile efflux-1 (HAE1) family protein
MTLSDVSIRNPVFAWMLMAALMIFGFIGYSRMGVGQLPDVDFPVVTITLTWQGAAPEVMETDIVDIVESSVMGIQGIRTVSSSIRQGIATVSVEFGLDKNIDTAVQEIQTRIAQAQRLLPTGMDPPIVIKTNPEDQPIVWLTISGDIPYRDIVTYVQDYLEDQFTTINGVGDVILGGYTDRNLRVWVDDKKLRRQQLTANDVVATIQKQHLEVPAGIIETPTREYNVRVMGEAGNVTDFGDIVVENRPGSPVYKQIRLTEVSTIEDSIADVRNISRTNAKRSVGLGIRKQRGANEAAVGQRVLARLKQVQQQLPKGLYVGVAFDRTQFVEQSIRELIFTLILSAIATSLVCWIFLGSWSATLNILLAIPTSILGTFLVIYFLGFTLNTFTVLGLSLAVGIVVDDAIMVLENIVRHREAGESMLDGARNGARQITFAATAATLALVAIFLPVAYMSGIIGKFFYQYGVTISIAVLLSLFEALTLTPMRCSQFLHVGPRTTWFGKGVDTIFKRLASSYKSSLEVVLNHPRKVMAIALIFFFVSLIFFKLLRKEFLPPQDQSLVLARLTTPVGSSITYTDGKFKEAEKFVMSRPEVDHYFSAIGGFGGGQVNTGFLFITLKDPSQRPISPPFKRRPSQGDLMVFFRKELNKIPDTKAVIQDLSLSGFSATRGFPVEFTLRGPNWETLGSYTQKFMDEMAKTGLMTDIDTDYLANVPEVHVIPNRVKASARGVDVDTIGSTVDYMIGGEPIAKYTVNGKRYDVRVRLIAAERGQAGDIDRLWVWNNRGELVRLRDVVDIKEVPASQQITRVQRERAISIFANVAPGKSQTDAISAVTKIAGSNLPAGYHVVYTGSAQTFQESFTSLIFVFLLGILVSYMVLASQFNSYIHPVTVLMALPFSISGALLALWLGNQSLNVYSIIGIILLMGIVKKNSILLVDFTNQFRKQGENVRESLISACPIRLRPILMTSFATITAALPPALAVGPGAEIRVPMAIAVIGGVIFSTLLTLFVVPCAYTLFAGLESGANYAPKPAAGNN